MSAQLVNRFRDSIFSKTFFDKKTNLLPSGAPPLEFRVLTHPKVKRVLECHSQTPRRPYAPRKEDVLE